MTIHHDGRDIWGKVFSQRRGRAGTADSDSIAQTAWDLKLRYGNVTSGGCNMHG